MAPPPLSTRRRVGIGIAAVLLGGAVALAVQGVRRDAAEQAPPAVGPAAVGPVEVQAAGPAVAGDEAAAITAPEAVVAAPVTTFAALDRFCDRTAANEVRLAPALMTAIGILEASADEARVLAVLGDARETDSVRNAAANLLRRCGCAALPQALLAIIAAPGAPRIRSYAAQQLGDMAVHGECGDEATPRLVALLEDDAVAVRREALFALARLRDPAATAFLDAHLADPACEDLADLMIACCGDLDRRGDVAAIRRLGRSDRVAIRVAAIHCLAGWGDDASRPLFESACAAPDARVSRAGSLALARLPPKPTDPAPGSAP